MKVHRTTLQLAAIAATAAAFVPRGPEIATRHRSFSPPSIVSLADGNADGNADGKSGSSDDGSSTSSPARSYLEDSSLKEPESYLDDMASGSDGSGGSAEEASKSVSSEYLEDMVVEDTPAEASVSVDEGEDASATTEEPSDDGITENSEETLVALLRIAASTGRGEFADNGQKDQAAKLVSMLEANNPTPEPTNNPLINGRWELVYSSSQLFRSSPFFMAGRAVCGTKDQADQYDWFCDMHRQALAISNIGTVRQIISPTLMVSEFEVKVGAVPFLNDFTPFSYSGGLPFTIDGSIVSQADITPTEDGNSWELLMDTVQIKGSNIPGLRTILDNGLQLQSRGLGSFLENNLDGYTNPRPVFETTYLTDSIRISRDQDGKIFVYAKESDESTSTDYGKVEADLGVLKLLGGFNDAVTKFYI